MLLLRRRGSNLGTGNGNQLSSKPKGIRSGSVYVEKSGAKKTVNSRKKLDKNLILSNINTEYQVGPPL